MSAQVIAWVCGYFDPKHDGHRSHFRAARALAGPLGRLGVIIHPDELCIKKKGFCYQPLAERIQALLEEPEISVVVVSIDTDGTVTKTLSLLLRTGDILAKGGDRSPDQHPIPQSEIDACIKVGARIVYNVGEPKRPEWSSTLIGKKALGLE